MYPPGVPRFDPPHWRTDEVRDLGTEAVLVGHFDRDQNRYGIPIDLTRRSREFYYTRFAVANDDEWLKSVDIGLLVMVGTGLRASARRRRTHDYIELRAEGGWPSDERFYRQDATQDDEEQQELMAQTLLRDGLSPDVGVARRREGRLVAWLLQYENTAPSGPWVGQAVVASDEAGEAVLEVTEIGLGVPETVRADLAYFACHAAAEVGARTVSTSLTHASLSLVGFADGEAGQRVLQTHFLDADPDAARERLRADLASKG
jgi:hypothetical protein